MNFLRNLDTTLVLNRTRQYKPNIYSTNSSCLSCDFYPFLRFTDTNILTFKERLNCRKFEQCNLMTLNLYRQKNTGLVLHLADEAKIEGIIEVFSNPSFLFNR